MTNKNPKQKQQGDVAIETIDSLPEDAKPVKVKTQFIIQQGSTQGNSHVVKVQSGVTFWEDKIAKYVINKSRTVVKLLHEGPTADHNSVVLNKGVNKFTAIYEMDHLTKMAAPVID